MTLEDLGNIGDFIGSITVLVTLVYLAVQVRQSRELLERNEKIALSETYLQQTAIRSELLRLVVESEHLAPILAKAGNDPELIETLSEEEKVRLRAHFTRQLLMLDNVHFQSELLLLDIHGDNVETEASLVRSYQFYEASRKKLGGVYPPVRLEKWIESRRSSENT